MTGATWYSVEGSWLGEFWTLLHLPYTLMAICFVLAGLALVKPINWSLTFLLAVAYFLGLGIAAHCFDQLPGMGTIYVKHITRLQLWWIGSVALAAALFIGIILIVQCHIWSLLWLVPLQVFFTFAYPMKTLFKGYFHTDGWFSVGFGAVPFLVGYFTGISLNHVPFNFVTWIFAPYLGMIVCLWISYIEILLSRFVRKWRKRQKFWMAHNYRTIDHDPTWVGWPRVEEALKVLCLVVYAGTLFLLLWN